MILTSTASTPKLNGAQIIRLGESQTQSLTRMRLQERRDIDDESVISRHKRVSDLRLKEIHEEHPKR